jgi:hypothetical protein
VEFALVAPLALLFVLGSIEFGRAMFLQHVAVNTARHGLPARHLEHLVHGHCAVHRHPDAPGRGHHRATTSVVVSQQTGFDVNAASPGEPIGVTVTIPFSQNSLVAVRDVPGKQIADGSSHNGQGGRWQKSHPIAARAAAGNAGAIVVLMAFFLVVLVAMVAFALILATFAAFNRSCKMRPTRQPWPAHEALRPRPAKTLIPRAGQPHNQRGPPDGAANQQRNLRRRRFEFADADVIVGYEATPVHRTCKPEFGRTRAQLRAGDGTPRRNR